jgi:hypothetical protein
MKVYNSQLELFPEIVNIPFTSAEVLSSIFSLKNKTSCGYDGLSNKIIKSCGEQITVPIIQTGFEVHPTPIQWVPWALSPGVKWPGREVDHSPPTSAEVKKMWIYTSTLIHLHGVVLN